MRSTLSIAVLLLSWFGQSASQKPAKPPTLVTFETYSQRMLAAADLMPEDGYPTRLAPGVRSFAEAVGHTIDTNFGVCAGARGLESPKKGVNHEQRVSAKSDLVAAMREAFDYCTPFVSAAAAEGTYASDLNFVNAHNAQMLVIMDVQLIARGLTPKGTEAASVIKK